MRRLLIIAALACGCSSLEFGVPPRFQSPILNSSWEPRAPHALHHPGDDSTRPARKNSTSDRSLRERVVQAAKTLEANPGNTGGYGLGDVKMIISQVAKAKTERFQSIYQLVRRAKQLDAFEVNGSPEPGDLVVFHNTADLNGNGKNDDWHSGCGFVIGDEGRGYQAVIRTGNQPRTVQFWPDGPDRRTVDGRQINSFLRVPGRSDPMGTDYLAGRLYAGHIDIDKLVASLH